MAKKPAKSTKSKPANKKGGSQSEDSRKTLAALFDEADSSEASNLLSVGEHKVRLNGMVYKKDPKKGEAVRAEFEKLTGDEEGKKISQLYKLRDADGNKGPGLVYIKRDLELLNYKDIEGKKFLKTLEKITEEQPMVIVRVADNGQYRNAFLQGLAEDGDEEENNEEESEIEVGDRVTGTNDDGDDIEGEVVKIKGSKATVKDDDDDKHVIDVSDLEKVEEEEEEEKPKKGKSKKKDEEEEEEEEEKPKKGKKKDEEEEEENNDDDDEIAVGDKVKGENEDGDDIEGEVVKIKGDTITVKDEDGDKHKCDVDDLEKVEEEEEEEKPKKKGKKGKKEEEEEEEKEIEVGDTVKWEDDDGDDITGEVKKIKGDKLIVEDDDGDEHKVDKDDAELVDDDD